MAMCSYMADCLEHATNVRVTFSEPGDENDHQYTLGFDLFGVRQPYSRDCDTVGDANQDWSNPWIVRQAYLDVFERDHYIRGYLADMRTRIPFDWVAEVLYLFTRLCPRATRHVELMWAYYEVD